MRVGETRGKKSHFHDVTWHTNQTWWRLIKDGKIRQAAGSRQQAAAGGGELKKPQIAAGHPPVRPRPARPPFFQCSTTARPLAVVCSPPLFGAAACWPRPPADNQHSPPAMKRTTISDRRVGNSECWRLTEQDVEREKVGSKQARR